MFSDKKSKDQNSTPVDDAPFSLSSRTLVREHPLSVSSPDVHASISETPLPRILLNLVPKASYWQRFSSMKQNSAPFFKIC